MVTSAAQDAARRLAGAASTRDDVAAGEAEAWVRELLGSYGEDNVRTVTVAEDDGQIVLRVVARNPGFLPPVIRRPMGFDEIDRTVRVRIEREV